MNKCCGNCKYVSRPWSAEPCCSCIIKDHCNKWQPKEGHELGKFTGPYRETRNEHL